MCAGGGLTFPVLIPGAFYSPCCHAGSCIGQEFDGPGGPYPGETLATGASVLWGGRRYLKSTTPLLEGEQLCCFGLVGAKIAVSRLLSLQIWVWASTDLCLSEHL